MIWSNGKASLEITSTSIENYLEYKIGSNGSWTRVNGKSITLTNLVSSDYAVYARLVDESGNTTDDAYLRIIEPIEAKIQFSDVTWSNGKACVTINTTSTDYFIEYQKNSIEESWKRTNTVGTSITVNDLSHNDTIYARLTDGYDNFFGLSNITIKDTQAPILETTKLEVTQLTATVFAKEHETGIKRVRLYYDYVDSTATNWFYVDSDFSNPIVTSGDNFQMFAVNHFDTITSAGTYKMYAVVYDVAGNYAQTDVTTFTKE